MRVGYDAYSRYAIGDTIRVYATSSGRVVPVSTVEKMRIWHIGSRGLASEHLPELFGLIGGGLVLWRCANAPFARAQGGRAQEENLVVESVGKPQPLFPDPRFGESGVAEKCEARRISGFDAAP